MVMCPWECTDFGDMDWRAFETRVYLFLNEYLTAVIIEVWSINVCNLLPHSFLLERKRRLLYYFSQQAKFHIYTSLLKDVSPI